MKIFQLTFFLLSVLIFTACDSAPEVSKATPSAVPAETPKKMPIKNGYGQLVGEEKALEMAEKMLEALGGREKWKSIKALNYVEKRDQKGRDTTFTYESWMDLEDINFKLELKGTTFHTFINVGEDGGKAYDLNKNRSAELRPKEMERFKYQDEHDMYKVIKRLAMGDELKLKMRNPMHFDVSTPDSIMLGGFNLNAQNLPEYYSSKIYMDGNNEKVMHFTGWKSVDGFFYPADGQTIDRNMTFIMGTWQPLMESIEKVFPRLESNKTK